MPAPQLHGSKQTLTESPPAGIELENVLPLLEQQWSVLLAVPGPQETKILIKDRVLGCELRSPAERDQLVLSFSNKEIDSEDDEEGDAHDFDRVRAQGKGLTRGQDEGASYSFGRCRRLRWLDRGIRDLIGDLKGNTLELFLVPKVEGGGGKRCSSMFYVGRRGNFDCRWWRGTVMGFGSGGLGEGGGSRRGWVEMLGMDSVVGVFIVLKLVSVESLEVSGKDRAARELVGKEGDNRDDGKKKEQGVSTRKEIGRDG